MWIITSNEFCSFFSLPLLLLGNFRLELSCFDLRLGVFFFSDCRRFRLYRRAGCKDGSFSVVIPGALGGRGDLASVPDIGTYLQKFLTFVSLLGLQFLISTWCTHHLV
jgi:hypothetical protein